MTVEHIRGAGIARADDPFGAGPIARPAHQLSGNDQFDRMGRWLELFMGTAEVSKHLAQTTFVPEAMHGKPADIAAAMMKGLELGIDPLDALGNLYVVKGRVGFSAEFMRRRVLEAGHEIVFDEQSDERCKVRGRRAGSQEWTTVVFTKTQADKAGVQNMAKFAADMLVARASSRLCRRVFPDVLAGAQIIEEVVDGIVIDADELATPARSAVARKRQPRRSAAESTPEPAENVPVSDLDEFPDTQTADNAQIDPEPQPANEPDEPVTQAQNRKMHALFRDAGLTDRDDRLTVTGAILGYRFDTSADLTKSEASKLIDTLEQWHQQGQLEHEVAEILNSATLAAENQPATTEQEN